MASDRLKSLFFLALLLLETRWIDGTSDNRGLTYEDLYKRGVEAYLDNDWDYCIKNFELAIDDWHWWRENTVRCRRQCHKTAGADNPIMPNRSLYEQFFESIVKNTLCLTQCKKDVFGSRMHERATPETERDFELCKHYDYLQLCYYQTNRMQDAANAAATVLAIQPGHEIMQNNLAYYLKNGIINIDDVVNLESEGYEKEYNLGSMAYSEENYEGVIDHMEHSLQLYWEAEDSCRLMCESPFEQGWLPDFISAIANHFTYTLRCKQRCSQKLSQFYGEDVTDFLPSHFNFLQYSYYQVNDVKKACEAMESYLTLVPDDPEQLRNRQFYYTVNGVKDEYFSPRKEVVDYVRRNEYEQKLMNFIEENFEFMLHDQQEKTAGNISPGKSTEEKDEEKEKVFWKYGTKEECKGPTGSTNEISSDMKALRERLVSQVLFAWQTGATVVMTDKDLNGTNRFVADGLASREDCKALINMVQVGAVEGDGYNANISPHTKSEFFQGITLGRIGLLVHMGFFERKDLELILIISDTCRKYVEHYFRLKKRLFFSFTHLVCRSARPEAFNRSLSDLSHEIHADNCILQDSGSCLKIPPAYTSRHYSAILYLNDDFDGGEFIFSRDKSGKNFESIVKPTCGRLVGFSAGAENPHGVRPVMAGTRCALALWFTHDGKNKELERTLALQLLEKLDKEKLMKNNH